jgi:hypothetical protein
MAKRTNQTFAKRQRENARKERQQRKMEKRLERRQQAAARPVEPGEGDVMADAPADAEVPGEPEPTA